MQQPAFGTHLRNKVVAIIFPVNPKIILVHYDLPLKLLIPSNHPVMQYSFQ